MSTQRIAERFAALTPAQRRLVYDKLSAEGLAMGAFPVVPRPSGAATPASYAQARLWFLAQLEPASTAYHIAAGLRLRGPVDADGVLASLAAIGDRHEALRTVFHTDADGEVLQAIRPGPHADLAVVDLRDTDPASREAAARAEADALNARPFDLAAGPLWRARVIRLADAHHLVVVVMHHIVSDGGSMQVVLGDFIAHQRAGASAWTPLAVHAADHALWQRQWLEAGERDRQLRHWTSRLGARHPVLQLPTDRPRAALASYQAADHALQLPAPLADALRARARNDGVSMFMLLLAGFQAALHRHTGERDLRVGVPVTNRQRVETESVVGFFVNTQVLRAVVAPRTTLADLVAQAREATLAAQQHPDLPFEQLVEALQPERSLAHPPLFQVMLDHRHAVDPGPSMWPGVAVDAYPFAVQGAQFELSVATVETPDGAVHATLRYARELFDASTIARFGRHVVALLQAIASTPAAAVADVVLDDADAAAERERWSTNPRRHDTAEPVHRLFERQATRRPDAVAVVLDDVAVSYRALDARANGLAHALVRAGARPGATVGLGLARSVDMVAALLAVLKTGAAYVPLDPASPRERLQHMVDDSGIAVLLTEPALCDRYPVSPGVAVLALDPGRPVDDADAAPVMPWHGDQLAYLMYTSGSTGRPKGVAMSHRVLVEHVKVAIDLFGIGEDDRVLQFASLNFDGVVEQLYPALCTGATLVLRGPDVWDSDTFLHQVRRHGVTVADLTTAYWFLLAQDFAARGPVDAGPLRLVHAGGEAMPPEGLKAWRDAGLGHVRLRNTYGPTEAAVTATALDCAAWLAGDTPPPSPMPIGGPLDGRALHVLDTELNPVPVGVAGELCIGGPLLARGYHRRPGLTAERFVAAPGGGRVYRTGDLVRWRADGALEYLGRADHQVKLRGVRVEPGEIEGQLLAAPGVREAVVVPREGPAGLQLVAYVSPLADASPDPDALRTRLAERLPEALVPSAIVVLDALPLNGNGKVDRAALPAPAEAAARTLVPPQGALEEALAAVWAEVLGAPQVGRHDNFFSLGGHSLLALRLVRRIADRLPDRSVTLLDVFSAADVASLARRLGGDGEREDTHRVLATGGRGTPLFLFPGLFVNGSEYGPLAQALAGDRPVHAFASHVLGRRRWDGFSLGDVAQHHADHIVALVGGGGACALLGWSLGGRLALETARRLQGRVDVRFVGLVDVTRLRRPDATPLTGAERTAAEAACAAWFDRSRMAEAWRALHARLDAPQRDACLRFAREHGDTLPVDGPGVDSAEFRLWAETDTDLALHRAAPTRIAGGVSAWLSAQTERAGTRQDWSAQADGGVVEEVVPGTDHLDIVRAPAFLASLRAALHGADR